MTEPTDIDALVTEARRLATIAPRIDVNGSGGRRAYGAMDKFVVSLASLSDALEAVSAERDAEHKRAEELSSVRWTADQMAKVTAERDSFKSQAEHFAMRGNIAEDERDRLHKAITEALAVPNGFEWDVPPTAKRILRAALDKEGNDDD